MIEPYQNLYVDCYIDTIVILEDGNRNYPRCPKCDMFVSHKDLNGRHLNMALC